MMVEPRKPNEGAPVQMLISGCVVGVVIGGTTADLFGFVFLGLAIALFVFLFVSARRERQVLGAWLWYHRSEDLIPWVRVSKRTRARYEEHDRLVGAVKEDDAL